MSTATTGNQLVPVTIGLLSGTDLHDLCGSVLPHADTAPEDKSGFPAFTVIRCEVEHGTFYAVATDRYTLAIARHPLPDDQPSAEGGITVPAGALRTVLRSIRRRERIHLTMDRDGLTFTRADSTRLRFVIPASPLAFLLNWRDFMGGKLGIPTKAPAAPVALNPALLARFTPAARHGLPLEFRQLAGKPGPVLVTCGTHFAGLISPVRLDSAAKHLPGWTADPVTDWRGICAPFNTGVWTPEGQAA
jgi:hypothetical protein